MRKINCSEKDFADKGTHAERRFMQKEVQEQDELYMKQAIELARKGCGRTNPNPMVGAIIEKNGHVIGQGYHEKYGELHAERNALADCVEKPSGATMYVTLEPCCHYGKQPPCTQAIIESGVKRVVIGSDDPNPLVAGKGVELLKAHGIEVITGVLREECDELNEIFFHYIKTGQPFVTMKYAMTMDGKTAAYTGKSQWITSDAARVHVHEQRNRHMAIMTGIGTVLADNPMLTCRLENGRNPIRIICDTKLRIPLDSNIVKTAKEISTIIATAIGDEDIEKFISTDRKTYKKVHDLGEAGCELINPGKSGEHLNLNKLVRMLGSNENAFNCGKIDSIYLEGGQTLNWSALNSGIVNKVNAYIAPKIFGGAAAFSAVGGKGVEDPSEAVRLCNTRFTQIGVDFLMEGDVCLQE